MKPFEYLFPRDLRVTDVAPKNVLLIGSCLSEAYRYKFSNLSPGTRFDHILYNNFSDLPEKTPQDLGKYDLQYLQIPLRSVLSDAVIKINQVLDPKFYDDIICRAKYTIDTMLDEGLRFNKSHGITTLISNFVIPQGSAAPSLYDIGSKRDLRAIVNDMNLHLLDAVHRYENAYLADIDAVASSLGKMYVLDDLIYFYSHSSIVNPIWSHEENTAPWTAPEPGRIEKVPDFDDFYPAHHDAFFEAAHAQMEHIYRVTKQVDQVKVVIFDLDNTLWRGQIGDHYTSDAVPPHSGGWPLGLWEAIHHLKARGILVTICSKNNSEFVRDNWDKAVNLPFITLSDFLTPRINYRSKAENIEEILNDFNLTAKSAVFVDDNPVERSSVLHAHPGIRVIGSNPFLTRRILLWSSETQTPKLTDESARRDDMVRQQISRESVRATLSRDEFLKSLSTKVTLERVNQTGAKVFSRVYELLNKTNQFNTSGKRWDFKELHELFEDGGEILAFSVADRFTDYGLVGVIVFKGATILQYVMSCRVLGMDVEIAALSWLTKHVISLGFGSLHSHIVETEANMPCRDVFTRAGFSIMEGRRGAFSFDKFSKFRVPPFVEVIDP